MHIRRDNICDEFDDNDRQMATSLAEPVSLAIANLQLRDNLRNQAKENGRDRVELSDQCIVHAVVSNNC